MLEVEDQQIAMPQGRPVFRSIQIEPAAGLDSGMQSLLMGQRHDRGGQGRPDQRLAAAQGQPSAGGAVKIPVFFRFLHDVRGRHGPPYQRERPRGADLRALSADTAKLPPHHGPAVRIRSRRDDASGPAYLQAPAAGRRTDAELRYIAQFLLKMQALGIVAPRAAQGAALEIDRRPPAGPVLDGPPLDMGDQDHLSGKILHCFPVCHHALPSCPMLCCASLRHRVVGCMPSIWAASCMVAQRCSACRRHSSSTAKRMSFRGLPCW